MSRNYSTVITGVRQAGDGSIHPAVIESDPDKLSMILREIYPVGKSLGGAISAEHGIIWARKECFMEMEDKTKIELMKGKEGFRFKQCTKPRENF